MCNISAITWLCQYKNKLTVPCWRSLLGYRLILFRIKKGGDKFQRRWCKQMLELYTDLFCSVLISWCQAANGDLSDFLALRDYQTAWEPRKKKQVMMLNNRQISLMRLYLYNWSFNKLGICPFKSRYELHPENVAKWICPPMRLSPLDQCLYWTVLALALVIYLLLCMKRYTRLNCWLQTNYQVKLYGKQIQKAVNISLVS